MQQASVSTSYGTSARCSRSKLTRRKLDGGQTIPQTSKPKASGEGLREDTIIFVGKDQNEILHHWSFWLRRQEMNVDPEFASESISQWYSYQWYLILLQTQFRRWALHDIIDDKIIDLFSLFWFRPAPFGPQVMQLKSVTTCFCWMLQHICIIIFCTYYTLLHNFPIGTGSKSVYAAYSIILHVLFPCSLPFWSPR